MLVSINQLTQYTGRNARTITNRLIDLQYQVGPKGAHLYESSEALPLIYAVDGLEAARAKQALSQASLNKERELKLRRERIPIPIVLATMNQIFNGMGAILKSQVGKMMTVDRVNDIFDKFRALPRKLKWQSGD